MGQQPQVMLDPKVMKALAPEVRRQVIQRLQQLEQERAEKKWKATRKAYLAELNEKAKKYFAWKLEQPEPEVPVTIYGLCGGPVYRPPRLCEEEQWDAYWRIGNRLASTGRDELPSEWIHAHRHDSDEV